MDEDDLDARFELVESGFSKEDDHIYDTAMIQISKEIESGKTLEQIAKNLKIGDQQLKGIIVDDYIKITLAEEHFKNGKSLKSIAKSIGVSHSALIKTKKSMIAEVQQTSVKAFHKAKLGGEFDDDEVKH